MRKKVTSLWCFFIIGGLFCCRIQSQPLIQRSEERDIKPETSVRAEHSQTHIIISRPGTREESEDQSELKRILQKCAEYCEKVKNSALFYVCQEKIKEEIVLSFEFFVYRNLIINETEMHNYIYDYQLIKKGGDIKESRTLIKENGKKRNEKNAQLKTKRFFSKRPVYGAVGFFSQEFQESYNYRLIKEDKIKGSEVYIIEAILKKKMAEKPNYGKLWVDKENFSIIKMEIEQESLEGFEELEKEIETLEKKKKSKRKIVFKPIFKTIHYYEVEKNGIRFPSKIEFREIYVDPAWRKREVIKSITKIQYDNYRFFIVDYKVKYE